MYAFRIQDDSWLELSAEQLDEMMCTATGSRPPPQVSSYLAPEWQQSLGDQWLQKSSLDLENMVFGMKSFVDSASSLAGAELPW